MTIDGVHALIGAERYRLGNEQILQDGIAAVLHRAGVDFRREERISPRDRLDFFIEPDLAVEVKIDGSISALTRQVMRYVEHPLVGAVLVVTTRNRLAALPATMNGKRVHALVLDGSVF